MVSDGTLPSPPQTTTLIITAQDAAPVLTVAANAAYTANDANPALSTPVLLSATATVSDVDNLNLASATVKISSGLLTGDKLNAVTAGTSITASYDASTGVLTLTGSDTLAHYQQVLDSVTYSSTSHNPTNFGTDTTRTISWVVSDGTLPSNTQATTLTITAQDVAPVLVAAPTAAYTANDANPALSTPVLLSATATVSDVDNLNLASATVQITTGLFAGDVLSAATAGTSITASYNAATGVLTLAGSDTLAHYQQVLDSVTYSSTSHNPTNFGTDTTRTITWAVSDGTLPSNTQATTLTITAQDVAPVLVAAPTAAYTANDANPALSTPVLLSATATVSDVDNLNLASATVQITTGLFAGDVLSAATAGTSITASYNAATGVLTLTGSDTLAHYQQVLDSVTYSSTSHNPTNFGTDTTRTITWAVSDGTLPSNTQATTLTITAQDAASTVTDTAGKTGWTEAAGLGANPAVVIDSGLTVIDPDNTTLASAKVSITNFVSGQDVLAFTNTNSTTYGNITASYDAATGILSLSSLGSTATLAQWQAALDAVTYNNTSHNPTATDRTITFVVNDGTLDSNTGTKTVSVTPTDTLSTVTDTAGKTGWTEAAGLGANPAVVIDSGLTVIDPDNTTLASAKVSITNFVSGQDVLAFTNTNSTTYGNITASYDAATGILSLSSLGSTATLAQWQAALDAVTYNNTSHNPTATDRTITFVVNDGTLDSNTGTKTVSVTPTDTLSTVTDTAGKTGWTEAAGLGANPAVVIDSGLTVIDPDNTTLASAKVSITNFVSGQDVLAFTNTNSTTYGNITASYDAATGILSLSSLGSTATLAQWQAALDAVTYNNTSHNPTATDRTITFVVNDGTLDSNTGTKTVSVTPTDTLSTVTDTAGKTGWTEAAGLGANPAVVIDSGLTVIDPDNTTLASAKVSITNFVSGQDVLAFTNTNSTTYGNITASYDAATGILSLSSLGSTATLAQWQAALDAVTYNNTSHNPTATDRTITFVVNDGTLDSNTGTKTVSVTPTDTLSTVTDTAGKTGWTEAAGLGANPAVVIDSGLTVIDPDNTTLASAKVSITNFVSGQDVLAFTNTNSTTYGNITASYDAATGILSLSSLGSTATLAQWQAALDAVTYNNTSHNPTATDRTITFVVNDGTLDSNTGTKTVSVTPTDTLSTVTDTAGKTGWTEAAGLGANPAVVIDSGLTVIDPDNTTLASAKVSITNFVSGQDVLAFTNTNSTTYGNITASYDAATGILSLSSLGSTATLAQWQAALDAVTYNNTSHNPTATDRTITFVVNDGTLDSNTGTKTVSVTPTDTLSTVTDTAGKTGWTEAAGLGANPAVVIDSGLTVIDPDNTTLASAKVSITNFVSGQDVLAFTNTNSTTYGNITASYDAATGILSLSSLGSTATLAQWQAALDAVTYNNTSHNPTATDRTITFVVNDGTLDSNTGTKTVSVTPTDTLSTVTDTAGKTGWTEAAGLGANPAVVIDSGLTVIDPDNTTLASAKVSITNFVSGQDVLAFTNTNSTTYGNITASYDAATGILSLSSLGSTATLAQWQAALDAVTYNNTSHNPTATDRTITFVVNDGTLDSNTGTKTVSVTPTDTLSTVTDTAGKTGWTEAAGLGANPAVVIDSGLTVIDPDNTTLASAKVSITNFVSGQDVLAFTNTNSTTYGNITASYDAATGILSLSSLGSTATLAQWQAALDAVTYNNTSHNPTATDRTITFVVNDGTLDSNTGTKTVSVTPTDTLSTVTDTAGKTGWTEAAGLGANPAVVIDSGLTVIDPDNTTLASAKVSITNFVSGQDVLAFTNTNSTTYGNITASYDAATGILSLSSLGSTATLAQWQAALDAVTYNNTSHNPTATDRTITFVVNDGTLDSNTGTKTVSVTPTDTLSTVTDTAGKTGWTEAAGLGANPAVVIDSGLTVIDPDNTTLASAKVSITNFVSGQDVLAFTNTNSTTYGNITASYDAATGILSLSSLGSTATLAQWQAALDAVTYNNTSHNPTATDRTITFVVNDGTLDSNTGTKTVSVTPTDNAPVTDLNGPGAGGSNATASFIGTPVLIAPSGTVSDVDSPNLASMTVTLTNHPDGSKESLSLNTVAAALVTTDHLTKSYNSSTGVLSITGSASQADYQTILEGISYNDTSVAPNTTQRTVTVVVSDSTLSSTSNNVTIGMNPQVEIAGGTVYQLNGGTLQGSLITIDVGGEIEGNGTVTGVNSAITSIVDNGNLEGFSNTLFYLHGNITGTGTLELLNPNTNMELGGSVASTLGVIFDGHSNSQLILDDPADFHAPISGFGGNDAIDARTMFYSSATNTVLSGNGTVTVGAETITRTTTNSSTTITLSEGATTATFTLLGDYTGHSFKFSSDGSGGTKFVDPIAVASGATVELQGTSWDSVMFLNDGGYGTLLLDNPNTYTGQIFGFTGTDPTHSDLIDLKGISFDAGTAWAYAGGVLTIYETAGGTTSTVYSLTFGDGEYTTANFVLTTDGQGGTLIADPPAGSATLNSTIENTGVIQLSSTPDLQLIQTGATLHGGGQVVLSDSDANVITGTSASVTLNNEDNTISGAGHLGNGELSLTNSGTIDATGTHAIAIDTGSNFVFNFGTLEASGSGGLTVAGAVANSGVLWANGANITVHGDVSGNGTAIIDGSGTVDFAAASSANVVFGKGAAGTLKLEDSFHFISGTISGFNGAAAIDLMDISSATASIAYHKNAQGTGGVLTVSDGTHAAQLSLLGQYSADNFNIVPDHVHGTLITVHYDLHV